MITKNHSLACDAITDEQHLDDLLSLPTEHAIETMSQLDGDIIVLGVGGKMGPTLARMAVRASKEAGVSRRIIGVSRFSQADVKERLQSWGVETIACDLLDAAQVSKLPKSPNVVAMTGMKFGSSGNEPLTWAMNAHVPSLICDHFGDSRVVAFSTGNVYGLSPVHLGGSVETDELHALGEYAQSCVGRERMYQYFSETCKIPMALLRLNYATEMRYGVLVDIAQRVWREKPIDVGMGYVNVIWQGDANAMALSAFTQVASSACILNIAGPEMLSVRRLAITFGEMMGKNVMIEGTESDDAFLSNAQKAIRLFGYPRVGVARLMEWVADWVKHDRGSLGKPTHFEGRDGRY